MHPALRKGPLFYNPPPFSTFYKKHPIFHFLPTGLSNRVYADDVLCRNEASLVSYCVSSNVSALATPSFDEFAAAVNSSALTLLPIDDTQTHPPRVQPSSTVTTLTTVRATTTLPLVSTLASRPTQPPLSASDRPTSPTQGSSTAWRTAALSTAAASTKVETTSSLPKSTVSRLWA